MEEPGPSDEDILEQQNAIRAEVAEGTPYIGDLEPLSSLAREYAQGNEAFLDKIEALGKTYSGLRRARGDGNCFYRAFLFSYLESLADARDVHAAGREGGRLQACIAHCKRDLLTLGYSELTWEDFSNVFTEQVETALSDTSRDNRLKALESNLRDPEVSNYAVMFLRFVTSCAIQLQQHFFEPFITGMTGLGVLQFCRSTVEPMGEECDHIHITALTNALGVPVRVVYLDRSEGSEASTHQFVPQRAEGGEEGRGATELQSSAAHMEGDPAHPEEGGAKNEATSHLLDPSGEGANSSLRPVVLLYRPGHYDILYPL